MLSKVLTIWNFSQLPKTCYCWVSLSNFLSITSKLLQELLRVTHCGSVLPVNNDLKKILVQRGIGVIR